MLKRHVCIRVGGAMSYETESNLGERDVTAVDASASLHMYLHYGMVYFTYRMDYTYMHSTCTNKV